MHMLSVGIAARSTERAKDLVSLGGFSRDGARKLIIPPVYEVYWGYIVFAFSVTMFVGLCKCVCKRLFCQRFFRNYLT